MRVEWSLKRDFTAIAQLECEMTVDPWTSDNLVAWLKQTNIIGVHVKSGYGDGNVLGHLILGLNRSFLTIERLVVGEELREQTATVLVDYVKAKLGHGDRTLIECLLNERDVDLQSLLKAQGFRWVKTWRGEFGDDDGWLLAFGAPAARQKQPITD